MFTETDAIMYGFVDLVQIHSCANLLYVRGVWQSFQPRIYRSPFCAEATVLTLPFEWLCCSWHQQQSNR